MSDVPSDAQARLLLQRLNDRTRLLAMAGGGPRPAFPWFVIPVVFAGLLLMLCPWAIPDGLVDIVFLLVIACLWAGSIERENKRLNKRLGALLKLLQEDGLLQEKSPIEAKE